MSEALIYAFLLVFVRCSAMMLASPVFGGQSTPAHVRVLTTVCLAGALTAVVNPAAIKPPGGIGDLGLAVANEAVAGLLLGAFMNVVLQVAQIAGSILDIQVGLSMSQTLNPIAGVSVTVLAQFKFMLAMVLYLSMNGHHQLLEAFANSYRAMPALGVEAMPNLANQVVALISGVCVLALQIAAPVLAVSLVVDASLGLINRAVPQMQVFLVGMPAKIILGMSVLAFGLPAMADGIQSGVAHGIDALSKVFVR